MVSTLTNRLTYTRVWGETLFVIMWDDDHTP